jgi:ubiquinone/menaquinone biosynthesis C-methylase UbiE
VTAAWNHNIHYYPLILAAVRPGMQRSLDVGCGEGMLARQLRRAIPHVVAMDVDSQVLGRARQQDTGSGVEYVRGDLLTHAFAPGSFDLVASVAALHHMDAKTALSQMRELLRPEGTLAIVGLARTRSLMDLARDLAAVPVNLLLRARNGYVATSAPIIWPPPLTYAQMRRLAQELLPGVRYRRHLLWRYSLIWTKPAGVR